MAQGRPGGRFENDKTGALRDDVKCRIQLSAICKNWRSRLTSFAHVTQMPILMEPVITHEETNFGFTVTQQDSMLQVNTYLSRLKDGWFSRLLMFIILYKKSKKIFLL